MTAKRYVLDDGLIYDNGKEMEDVVDVLNEYAEENEQLKHYKEAYGTEIVKIKQTIKDMMENERTELGQSVLRQLWEAIQ